MSRGKSCRSRRVSETVREGCNRTRVFRSRTRGNACFRQEATLNASRQRELPPLCRHGTRGSRTRQASVRLWHCARDRTRSNRRSSAAPRQAAAASSSPARGDTSRDSRRAAASARTAAPTRSPLNVRYSIDAVDAVLAELRENGAHLLFMVRPRGANARDVWKRRRIEHRLRRLPFPARAPHPVRREEVHERVAHRRKTVAEVSRELLGREALGGRRARDRAPSSDSREASAAIWKFISGTRLAAAARQSLCVRRRT